MMNYTLKTEKGEITTVRACDLDQAKILASVRRNNKDYFWATVIAANNKI